MANTPRIYIATTNPGKLREFQEAASALNLSIQSLPEIARLPVPVEDGETFEANARIKAEYYSLSAPGELVLAEDSGLAVDGLGGAPGVYSARYAAIAEGEPHSPDSAHSNSDDAANNAVLIRKLGPLSPSQRHGKYVCVIAIASDGQSLHTFRGEVEGELLTQPRGNGGFGYDPLFYLPALGQTFAELPLDRKRHLSHRGNAFREFLKWYGAEQP